MPSQAEIRKQLTDQIVSALEKGVRPWRKTWTSARNTGRAANISSQKPYRGLNPLLLEIHAHQHGFRSKWWGTYLQWQQLGGCQVQKRPEVVRQGHWAATICFYKAVSKVVVDATTGEEDEERFRILRTFCVFNADQVVGAERFQVSDTPVVGSTAPDFGPAEELIEATGADIRYGGDRAFYSPSGDFIQLPNRDRFCSPGSFAETALHELSHWACPRLNWTGSYAQGELVAEIAACFVSAELGVPNGEGLANHASYVKSWLDAMRGDSSFIFKASSQASKVADYLLSFTQQPEEVPTTEGELVTF